MKFKKLLLALFLGAGLLEIPTALKAQEYKSSLGLGTDFGAGATVAGPVFKHFFNSRSAVQAEVLFGGNSALLHLFYQYHLPIKETPGLNFFFGGGPGLDIVQGGSAFLIRPMAGLEYKLKDTPLAFHFDWRPAVMTDNGTHFQGARFGAGIKYCF